MEINLSPSHLAKIENWFDTLANTNELKKIDEIAIDILFDELGAKRDISLNAEKSLGSYSNKSSRLGMEAVWGKKRYNDFVESFGEFIAMFESVEGNRELPKLSESGKKDSGMKEFFHEFTSYAYGLLSFDEFKERTEVRVRNGKLWQEGKKDERIRIDTPISDYKDKLIGSIPPGFFSYFWFWLENSKK